MAAKKKKGGFTWSGDGGPCTTPEKEAAKAAKTEQERIAAEDLKESRIEQIMSLMRQVATKTGAPTWDTKIRKALAVQWKMEDKKVRVLSNEAHKRVIAEAKGQEAGSIQRNTLLGLDEGLRTTFSKKDWKSFAVLGELGRKITEGPVQVEVSVKAKEPTAADGALAVREMFGVRVTNEEKSDDGPEAGPPEGGVSGD